LSSPKPPSLLATYGAKLTERQSREAAFYDARATVTSEELRLDLNRLPVPGPHLRPGFRKVVDAFGPLEGKVLLDIACGDGRTSVWLAMAGATVVGVDVSSASLRRAEQRAAANNVADRTSFVQVPAEELAIAFSPATFDGATGYAAVHHVDLRALAVNLDVVLKHGAFAIFPLEPVAYSATMDRLRKSRLFRRVVPVGNDTEDEEIIEAAALADQTLPLRVHADPYHLTTQLLNLIPINAHTARFLERFLTLSGDAENGVEELALRLARLDRAILSKAPGARRLCRHATITMRPP
jgi:2-polyprenyl-3-methyl-5-hydroxy-6-metoxy-1,4-benzoquinol methylase